LRSRSAATATNIIDQVLNKFSYDLWILIRHVVLLARIMCELVQLCWNVFCRAKPLCCICSSIQAVTSGGQGELSSLRGGSQNLPHRNATLHRCSRRCYKRARHLS